MNTVRCVTITLLVLLLLATVSIPTALGSQGGIPVPSSAGDTATYSGDDDYDPAAGGTPEQSVIELAANASPLVDCTLSPGEIAARRALIVEGGFSGDDDYDPAAGGMPELSVIALPERSALSGSVTYSGDDDYDPAAGGMPELSVIALAANASLLVDYTLSPDEIAARRALTIEGGFSGDDDYDPAAGGAPELSLLSFVQGSTLIARDSVSSGN